MKPGGESEANPVAKVIARFRVALGLATIAMLLISWPLWVETDVFPRVPFVARLPQVSSPVSWGLFGLLIASVAAMAAGFAWRATLGLSLVLLTALILQDQHRFQPWVYQYLMTGFLLTTLTQERALTYIRLWFAALYLHSGLSKLDISFCQEMGSVFLATAVQPLGLVPSDWPPNLRVAATLAMPVWEIGLAAALIVPSTRRIGIAGALLLHATLLGILGPFGLRHSTIVLVWNAAMVIEVLVIFGPSFAKPTTLIGADSRLGLLARAVFWAAVILPLGERWGILDAWPSHALYASHGERTEVFVYEEGLEGWPAEVRHHLGPEGSTPWRRLDLTGWSRAVRGVPVYPQGRACNGLAEELAARYGGHGSIRVIQWGRADRWTGRRRRLECIGLESIRRQGDRYRLNAHPASPSH